MRHPRSIHLCKNQTQPQRDEQHLDDLAKARGVNKTIHLQPDKNTKRHRGQCYQKIIHDLR